MYIQLKEIQELFPDIPGFLSEENASYCLSGFFILSEHFLPSEYSSHCLYVTADPDILIKISPLHDLSFLLLTKDSDALFKIQNLNLPFSTLLLQTDDMDMVCLRLQKFFDDSCGMGLLTDSLLEILFFEGGIQAMIEQVFQAFKNPIYVFDADFKLIAHTCNVTVEDQGKAIIENGRLTDDDFKILNQTYKYEKLQQSEYPIKSVHPKYGFEQLLCAIDTKKDMGHIVINGINHSFSEIDSKMLYLLKKAIDQQMKKDEFIRNNRGFNYEYFLKDLLDGKIATGKQFHHRLNYVNSEFSGTMYCMVVETARSSQTLNTMHIRSVFETHFPGTRSLMYNGAIIILFSTKDTVFQPDDLAMINTLCEEQGIYAGMGNSFQNITSLADYYKQGLRSIELGICHKNSPGLFLYRDYYLSHIANIFAQKESANTFCHPQLKILLDYDREHNTDLSHILYTYLICERNMNAAAQVLYIHRNTLVYRLKKIKSLITIDYEDYLERQHIILSYELYQAEK
ncbi:MAG: hypothetical protein HFG80_11590 [Eubacterium sp.]|jgi:Regulator of polyketide synthase expression|nr:hypothetical protein [Eubacterium sp.]